MIKNIIAPVQAWLLSQKRCVGCGTPLIQGKKKTTTKSETVTCKCNRIYIVDSKTNTYRRAKLDEM